MRVMHDRCAGIDVGKEEVVVCVRLTTGGEVSEEIEAFGTMTPDLLGLGDWLRGLGVTQVVMEATGVYWKPVYYLLEDDFALMLVNAAHFHHVPGRKTDVIDAQWLAEVFSYGLLSASFVPPKPIRELRDLTRYRSSLGKERTREVNRLQKMLEDANIKLASVATDVLGVSGREMISGLIEGQAAPEVMAELARGRLRAKIPQLSKALTGRFQDHHRFLVSRMLSRIGDLETDIGAVSERIEEVIAPFAGAVTILDSIPGVGQRVAQVIVAEIGVDMSRFPTASHLASWAGRCPGQRDSAGKKGSGRPRNGSRALGEALTEAAMAASRSKRTYLHAYYLSVRRRRGHHKAIGAVAHKILVIAHHLLVTGALYQDPGPDIVANNTTEQIRKRAIRQLENLGYKVTLDQTAA
ncbi:MAG: IS110 family transposase [bacterium]